MAGFLAELRADLRSRIPLLVWVLTTAVLAATGPFGSYGEMTLAERGLFWAPVLAVCIAAATLIRAFVYGALNLRSGLGGSVLITALMCLALCPPLMLVLHGLFGERPASMPGLAEIVLLIASVSLGVCSLRHSAEIPGEPGEGPAEAAVPVAESGSGSGAAAEAPQLPRLMRRVDPGLQGDLWSMTVRDHYVDVVTSAGPVSLLMRFGDAIEEAEPVEGLQIHRSHWVALSAIEGIDREGQRLFVRVKGGQRLPVSKAHRAKVEEHPGLPPAPQTTPAVSSAA
jgi:hypothetical protein